MLLGMAGGLTRRVYLAIRYNVLPRLGHEIMRWRNPSQLRVQWPEGEIPLGPRVCVFVHWDGAGGVRPHVLHQVRALAEAGLSVVFVTNAGRLQPEALDQLKPLCAGVMVRGNVGYDFGAWAEGIARLSLPRPNTDMLIIANDSVYGPVRLLDGVLNAIDFAKADFWGCTESWQHRYHLQSYFMAFSPALLRSAAWTTFWQSVRPTWSKTWLIRLYEIGLTQGLLRAGFHGRAIWPYQTLIRDIDADMLTDFVEGGPNLADPAVKVRQLQARRLRKAVVERTPLNPTSDLWRQLLAARYPFIKRELLRDNPTKVPDVAEWRDVLSATSDVLPAVLAAIELDLQRTLKNKAP